MEHRHLTAVRWRTWRLYKHKERGWQLFDLDADPREEHDVAANHPGIAATMATRHEQWAATLAPLGRIPKLEVNQPQVPTGYGWVTADGGG